MFYNKAGDSLEVRMIMKQKQLKILDEISLWKTMTQGNEKSFEALYARYYDSMFYYGLRFSSDTELLKDCIQDVFVTIFENSSLNHIEYVQAYLLRSMRNMIISQIKPREGCSLNELPFDISIEDSAFDTFFGQDDDDDLRTRKNLTDALRTLNGNQKQVLYLRYVKNMSYREIAEVLNITSQSAQNQISRILMKLKRILTIFSILFI